MDELSKLLKKAAKEPDPVKKRALLNSALAADPQNPDALRELLLLGGLGLKRSVDFTAFRCYALNVFDQPDKYDEAARAGMIAGLTASPELQACLAVSPDTEGFIKDYLSRICGDYVRIFMEGDNHRNGTLMGIKLGNHAGRMARYAADMLKEARAAALPAPWNELVPEALLQAFDRCWGNASQIEMMTDGDE